jgi:hypothetical protein
MFGTGDSEMLTASLIRRIHASMPGPRSDNDALFSSMIPKLAC